MKCTALTGVTPGRIGPPGNGAVTSTGNACLALEAVRIGRRHLDRGQADVRRGQGHAGARHPVPVTTRGADDDAV